MPTNTFYYILDKVTPLISREDTHLRRSISAGARLEATLIYLATGASYTRLQFHTRISKASLCLIIPDTCRAIYSVLKEEYMKTPRTPAEWSAIGVDFEKKWNFTNCVGAIDGKHVQIKPPPNSGSYYFNYKQTHSIVLLGVADANYELIYADVGTNGRVSDGGVWSGCSLSRNLVNGSIKLPTNKVLPKSATIAPYVFVADDAFPLKPYLLKPYPFRNQNEEQRIFSYRLSRARRIVENAFGIMSNKFRVLQTSIALTPDKAEHVVLATIVLHNLLRREYSNEHTPQGSIDVEDIDRGEIVHGSWRQDAAQLLELERRRDGRVSEEAREVREAFCKYFNNEGQVPWQRQMAGLRPE
ncbi:putative nuclease HARBI1 [Hyalella azteca]|uniref:Nuclease HARBI1 n=2 Tax=Hyalella azteca TaxID=294128 RepID=A0A8B7PGF2_HYAAZ|nr:putative nuclease HARBI1 [Hyalella azteca]